MVTCYFCGFEVAEDGPRDTQCPDCGMAMQCGRCSSATGGLCERHYVELGCDDSDRDATRHA